MDNFKHLFLDQLNNSKNFTKCWLYFIETSDNKFEMKLEFGDSDELFYLPNLEFFRMAERVPVFKFTEELNPEPTEVQFDEQEILLEEIDFSKDTVETFDSFDEFLEKKGIPQTFFQKHGYPSVPNQSSDTENS